MGGSQTPPGLNVACKRASSWLWSLNNIYAFRAPADAPRSLRLTYLLESHGGRLALLLCTVDSHPPAQLALSHAGHLLASSTTTSVPNTLRLELWEPRPSDEGLYSCSARSPLGQANTSLELQLEGEAGPKSRPPGVGSGVVSGWIQLTLAFLAQVCR